MKHFSPQDSPSAADEQTPGLSGAVPERRRVYRLKLFRPETMRLFLQQMYSDGYRIRNISELLAWYVLDFMRVDPGPCAVRAEMLPKGGEHEALKKFKKRGFRPVVMIDGITFLVEEGESGGDELRAGPDVHRQSAARLRTGGILAGMLVIAMLLLAVLRTGSPLYNGLLLFGVCAALLLAGNCLLPLLSRPARADTLLWLRGIRRTNARGETLPDVVGRSLLYAAVTAAVATLVYSLFAAGGVK